MIVDAESAPAILRSLEGRESLVVDLETTGLSPYGDTICGVAVATPERESFYFPAAHGEESERNLAPPLIDSLLRRVLPSVPLHVGFNYKFDMEFEHQAGGSLPQRVRDPMLAAHLLNENEPSFSLANLSKKYLGAAKSKDELAEELKRRKWGKGELWRLPVSLVGPYAEGDVLLTQELDDFYARPLQRWQLDDLYAEVCDYEIALTRMELNGMQTSRAVTLELMAEATENLARISAECRKLTGEATFNPGSPMQVNRILGLTSSAGEILDRVMERGRTAEQRQLARLVRDYRGWVKLSGSYCEPYLDGMDEYERLHPNLQMIRVKTSRLSCTDPNLQAVPRKAGEGPVHEVKRVFIAREGHVLGQGDYSQAELRFLAHFANDTSMLETFKDPTADIHAATMRDIGSQSRDDAKRINFGVAYGLGGKGFSERTGKSLSESKKILEKYHAQHPGIRRLMASLEDIATVRRYIKLWTGRLRHFGPTDDPHKAMSNFIQGGVAEMLRKAILQLDRDFRGSPVLMTMQVHDSLMFEIPEDLGVAPLLHAKDVMEHVMDVIGFRCPIKVDTEIGRSWSSLEKIN